MCCMYIEILDLTQTAGIGIIPWYTKYKVSVNPMDYAQRHNVVPKMNREKEKPRILIFCDIILKRSLQRTKVTSNSSFPFCMRYFVSFLHAMAISLSFIHTLLLPKPITSRLCESRWPRVSEHLLASGLAVAVRQRELEVLGEELLDVRAADVLGVVDLNDLQDLHCERTVRMVDSRD